jgi:hypothetical protein
MVDSETNPHSLTDHSMSPSQFGIKHVLYGVTLLATGFALHPSTGSVSLIFIALWAATLNRSDATIYWGKVAAIVSVMLLVLWFIGRNAIKVRGDHGVTYCCNRVKQITLAMLNYESVHGTLPQSTYVSDSGMPYSWRVELLPYMEMQSVYDAYSFDEPWNGPGNLKLLDSLPGLYSCTFQPNYQVANYKLVVGAGAAFDANRAPVRYLELTDGSSNTIAIVEDHTSTTPWTKPEDLTIDQAMKLINDRPNRRENLHAREYSFQYDIPSLTIGFLDGHVELFYPGEHPPVQRSMFTFAGGERDSWGADLYENRPLSIRRPRTDRYALLFLYPLVAFLPAIIAFLKAGTSVESPEAD